MTQLHILRGVPPNINGKAVTLDEFLAMAQQWRQTGAVFGSWTRRGPKRLDELQGGSVYFVAQGHTRFRMPLICVEPVANGNWGEVEPKFAEHHAFVCEASVIPVEMYPVRFMRGWRYLRAEDAPADIPTVGVANSAAEIMPAEMVADLKREGLL